MGGHHFLDKEVILEHLGRQIPRLHDVVQSRFKLDHSVGMFGGTNADVIADQAARLVPLPPLKPIALASEKRIGTRLKSGDSNPGYV